MKKNGGRFLKIFFTHEKNGGKFGTPKNPKNQKFSKSKSVLPELSARFFYAGERRPRPIWGPPGQFFPQAGKIPKMHKFCLFSLVGPWALFTRFGALAAIHPSRYANSVMDSQGCRLKRAEGTSDSGPGTWARLGPSVGPQGAAELISACCHISQGI